MVEKYQLPLFTLFRPACPAFSFVDVDTYGIAILEFRTGTCRLIVLIENELCVENQLMDPQPGAALLLWPMSAQYYVSPLNYLDRVALGPRLKTPAVLI